MEQTLRAAPAPLPAVAHSPRLEAQMTALTGHMGELAAGIKTVIAQNDVTRKYISLLEMNQVGKARITPTLRTQAKQMAAEGMNNADIGRLLRISRTAVSLIVRDQYKDTAITDAPAETLGDRLDGWIEREQSRVVAGLAKLEGGAL